MAKNIGVLGIFARNTLSETTSIPVTFICESPLGGASRTIFFASTSFDKSKP